MGKHPRGIPASGAVWGGPSRYSPDPKFGWKGVSVPGRVWTRGRGVQVLVALVVGPLALGVLLSLVARPWMSSPLRGGGGWEGEVPKEMGLAGRRDVGARVSAFGFDLVRHGWREGGRAGNVVVSGPSVATALGLAATGATPGGEAGGELMRAMRLPLAYADGRATYADALGLGEGGRTEAVQGATLVHATGAWVSGEVRSWFVDEVRRGFGADVGALVGGREGARQINAWVESRTVGLIKDLVDTVDERAVAALVSAVYFKGSWTQKFDAGNTRDGTWTGLDGQARPARMMHRQVKSSEELSAVTVSARWAELPGIGGMAELSYGTGGRFRCLMVLPAKPGADALDHVVRALTPEKVGTWSGLLRVNDLALSMPRFRVEWGVYDLIDALRDLGVSEAFDGHGAFLGMIDDPSVVIGSVLHKAAMEVNEEGTEAAAATAVLMMRLSMVEPIAVAFDRPFVMMVQDPLSEAILFAAVITDPTLT